MQLKFRLTPQKLVWICLCYCVALFWIHYLARDKFNVEYYKQYVTLRCTAAHTERSGRSLSLSSSFSEETTVELADALRRCQDIEVVVDGVWGGISGTPSVRLKIVSEKGAHVEFKHYSVSVNPILGTASIEYGLTPSMYYLNL